MWTIPTRTSAEDGEHCGRDAEALLPSLSVPMAALSTRYFDRRRKSLCFDGLRGAATAFHDVETRREAIRLGKRHGITPTVPDI